MSDISCRIEGCGRPLRVKSHQLCNIHYIRFRTMGDPLAGGEERGKPLQWIKDNRDSESNECLIWPFAKNDRGYGRMSFEGKHHLAHRLMCEMVNGPSPTARHEAAHSCGKGHEGCCNPKHLRWATPEENQADKIEHGTSNRGVRNAHAKLNEDAVNLALKMKDDGVLQKDIALHLGVSNMAISDLFNGHLWSWLTGIKPKQRGQRRIAAANDNEVRRAA